MKFEYLEVQNWKSFKHKKKWNFNNYELITAKNGTGKTSMMQAITYLLYSKLPTGFNLNTIRNNDEEECKMKLLFSHNYKSYEIIKSFGGNNRIAELYIDGELVAESVRNIDIMINEIVDYRIATILWTQSLTDSEILAPNYIKTVILEDALKDPNQLINYYKSENYQMRKEIASFDDEIVDIESIESNLDKIKSQLKEKGSSNNEYHEALKVLDLKQEYEKYSKPELDFETVKSFLTIAGKDLNESLEKIKNEIAKASEYKKFETMKKPKISYEDFSNFKNLLSGNNLDSLKLQFDSKIEKESEYKKFETMKEPTVLKEEFLNFKKSLNNNFDISELRRDLDSKIEKESEYKKFLDLKEPKLSLQEIEKFLNASGDDLEESKQKLDEQINKERSYESFIDRVEPKWEKRETEEFLYIAGTDFESSKIKLLEEKSLEQEKTINRFLGISKESIIDCVEKSVENHECIFCKSNFDESHKLEIEEELDKPSRDDLKIKKINEKLKILDRYTSIENAKYDLTYWTEKIIYEEKIKDTSYLDSLIEKRSILNLYENIDDAKKDKYFWNMKKLYEEKSKDTSYLDMLTKHRKDLNIYDSIDDYISDENYWKMKDLYEEKSKNTDYLDSLIANRSLLDLYNSIDDYISDENYWKMKDLYEEKSKNTDYLDSLNNKLKLLNKFDSIETANENYNYYNYKNMFEKALEKLPNYVELIENHDESNLELWQQFEILQSEYFEALKQEKELNRINAIKKQVDENYEKLDILNGYVREASTYYMNSIINKTSSTLSSINERYKQAAFGDEGFFVIVEDEYHSLNIVPVARLSSGEKTMFALSLLFAIHDLMTPDLPFLFDETFSALDVENLNEVQNFLRKSENQVFIITHDLSWGDKEEQIV